MRSVSVRYSVYHAVIVTTVFEDKKAKSVSRISRRICSDNKLWKRWLMITLTIITMARVLTRGVAEDIYDKISPLCDLGSGWASLPTIMSKRLSKLFMKWKEKEVMKQCGE